MHNPLPALGCLVGLILGSRAAFGDDEPKLAPDLWSWHGEAMCLLQTEGDIDQDILATRGRDWQRAGIGRVETQAMREHTGTRTGRIIDACMQAKGFGLGP